MSPLLLRATTVCERATPIVAVLYLFFLWFHRIFLVPQGGELGASEIYLVGTAPVVWLALAGQWRVWRRLPTVAVCVAIAAAMAISTVLYDGEVPWRILGRFAVQTHLILLFAHAVSVNERVLARGVVVLACLFSLVALLGAALATTGRLDFLPSAIARGGFVARDAHPLFGNWPRLTGGFSSSAENCGLWAAMAVVVLLVATRQWSKAWWFVGAAGAVGVLTFSINAACVAAALPLWLYARTRRARPAVIVAIAIGLALLAIQLPVHRGPKLAPEFAVAQLASPIHHAVWIDDAGLVCRPRVYPDGTVATRYALAKYHSLQLWLSRPVFGVGGHGFRDFVTHERSGSWSSMNPYYKTHGAYLGVLAEQGLLGIALYGILALLVLRLCRRGYSHRPRAVLAAVLGLTVLAVAAVDLDSHRERFAWILIGLVQGATSCSAFRVLDGNGARGTRARSTGRVP